MGYNDMHSVPKFKDISALKDLSLDLCTKN